jgi:hypothetical protein
MKSFRHMSSRKEYILSRATMKFMCWGEYGL